MLLAYYRAMQAAGGGPLLLDTLTNAPLAAYSSRKLRTGYTGAAYRVRRDSDNAEQDIGFTSGGAPDVASLASFCGTALGWRSKLYNQAASPGVGSDLVQATAAKQPNCWDGTAVSSIHEGASQQASTPSMYFAAAAAQWMDATIATGGGSALQTIVTGRDNGSDTASGHNGMLIHGANDAHADAFSSLLSFAPVYKFSNTRGFRFNENSGSGITGFDGKTNPFVFASSHDGTNGIYYLNGSATDTVTGGTGAFDTSSTLRVGSDMGTAPNNNWEGWFAEIIITTAVSTSDRAKCEASAKTFWSTP